MFTQRQLQIAALKDQVQAFVEDMETALCQTPVCPEGYNEMCQERLQHYIRCFEEIEKKCL